MALGSISTDAGPELSAFPANLTSLTLQLEHGESKVQQFEALSMLTALRSLQVGCASPYSEPKMCKV